MPDYGSKMEVTDGTLSKMAVDTGVLSKMVVDDQVMSKMSVNSTTPSTLQVLNNTMAHLGVTYYSRMDTISIPDFTIPPSPDGADVIFGTSGFQVSANQTVYISTIIDTTYAAVAVPMPAVTMTELYVACSVAPGSGQSVVYTVLKNGVATNLATTISGSGVSASDTG